jgi:hypothetical protein
VLTVQIINTATGAVVATLGTYSTKVVLGDTLLPDATLQTQTGTAWTVPAGGGSFSIRYTFTFLSALFGNGFGDDIGVSPPTTTCV